MLLKTTHTLSSRGISRCLCTTIKHSSCLPLVKLVASHIPILYHPSYILNWCVLYHQINSDSVFATVCQELQQLKRSNHSVKRWFVNNRIYRALTWSWSEKLVNNDELNLPRCTHLMLFLRREARWVPWSRIFGEPLHDKIVDNNWLDWSYRCYDIFQQWSHNVNNQIFDYDVRTSSVRNTLISLYIMSIYINIQSSWSVSLTSLIVVSQSSGIVRRALPTKVQSKIMFGSNMENIQGLHFDVDWFTIDGN